MKVGVDSGYPGYMCASASKQGPKLHRNILEQDAPGMILGENFGVDFWVPTCKCMKSILPLLGGP